MSDTKMNPSAAVGLERLVIWPLETDTNTELKYGEAYEFDKVLMSAQDDPSVAEGGLNADNIEVEHIIVTDGGKLVIGVTDLTSGERQVFFGETLKNGSNITNISDKSNPVAVAYMTKRADGRYNLKKFFKVNFAPDSESDATAEKGSIKFNTRQITGNYRPLVNNGDVRVRRMAVDAIQDSDVITQWFKDATYTGPTETTETEAASVVDGEQGTDEPQG